MQRFNEDGKLDGHYCCRFNYYESCEVKGDMLTIFCNVRSWNGVEQPEDPSLERAIKKSLQQYASNNLRGWTSFEAELFDVDAILSEEGITLCIDDSRLVELLPGATEQECVLVKYLKPRRRTPWADWPKQPTG